jgi:apolipoprotein D and lipocalin family protein
MFLWGMSLNLINNNKENSVKFCLFLSLLVSSLVFAGKAPLPTVDNVDLERYLGTWYEISSFPQKFQKGCTATEATYSLRRDGDIKVSNSCRLITPDGKLKKSIGRAWITNKNTNAKLKVQFFLKRFRIPFFSGNYWILDLDKNYESVLIGDPTRQYLWILSRRPILNQDRYDELVERAKELNFDTSKLVKTIH